METLGSRLHALRERHGMKQTELAKAIGITSAAISAYELGKSVPRRDVLQRLADYFRVSIDFLLGRTAESGTARRTGGYDLSEVAENLPPDLVDAIVSLPAESRHVFLRARQDLDEEDWRSIISFIRFRIAEAERKQKEPHD